MPRRLKIAAAQMSPCNEGVSREEIVDRMLVLVDEAAREGVRLIAGPELAPTTRMTPSRQCQNVLGRRRPPDDGGFLQPMTNR